MLTVSARTLNILAALVWYVGGVVLIVKGGSLVLEADELSPEQYWHWLAIIAGLLLGGIKGVMLFSHFCQKNLDRIDALKQPRIWQFFRPQFFFFLALMVLTGATLSRLASGHYYFLIAVAILDLSIAVALLGSSHVFWKRRAFSSSDAA